MFKQIVLTAWKNFVVVYHCDIFAINLTLLMSIVYNFVIHGYHVGNHLGHSNVEWLHAIGQISYAVRIGQDVQAWFHR